MGEGRAMRTFQTAGGRVEQVRFTPGGRGLALLVRERIEVEVAPDWWHKMGEREWGELVTPLVRIDLDTGAESRTPLDPPGSWAALSADGSRAAFGGWWYEPR